jgi:hypothetical protein
MTTQCVDTIVSDESEGGEGYRVYRFIMILGKTLVSFLRAQGL